MGEQDVGTVRRGGSGSHCPRSDPRQRAKIFGARGRGMGMISLSTTRGNKMWAGTKMGPSKRFKSLSHIVAIQLNISLI